MRRSGLRPSRRWRAGSRWWEWQRGGSAGCLFGADWRRTYRVGDAADCARAVLELAALDLRHLGARARAAAVGSYGWDRKFTELVGLYRRLLSEAPSTARARGTPPSSAPRISV